MVNTYRRRIPVDILNFSETLNSVADVLNVLKIMEDSSIWSGTHRLRNSQATPTGLSVLILFRRIAIRRWSDTRRTCSPSAAGGTL